MLRLGDGVRYTRALFSLAAKLSPCVIFIDEVDALLGAHGPHRRHFCRLRSAMAVGRWGRVGLDPADAFKHIKANAWQGKTAGLLHDSSADAVSHSQHGNSMVSAVGRSF